MLNMMILATNTKSTQHKHKGNNVMVSIRTYKAGTVLFSSSNEESEAHGW